MGFKEVASLDADVTVALGKKDPNGKPYPKQAEGYYLGSRTVQNKRGESKLHFLQTSKGNLGIWGTTDLNRKVGQVPAGTMVRITSTGTKPTPNGDMYTYKVEQDDTNTIPVELSTATGGSVITEDELEESTGSSGYGDDDDDEVDGDGGYETPVPMAASSADERKAKVEALLGKGKRK